MQYPCMLRLLIAILIGVLVAVLIAFVVLQFGFSDNAAKIATALVAFATGLFLFRGRSGG